MNKKFASIISCLIIIIAGSGATIAHITDEEENTDISSISESFSEPETTSATALETVATTETISENQPEIITETESVFSEEVQEIFTDENNYVEYHFRNEKLLNQHFEKHGGEFDYSTASEYEKGASDVINSPDALFKTEAEDGDGVYYIESSNEFVILSTDGFIRTYFRPSAGIDYFNRQ